MYTRLSPVMLESSGVYTVLLKNPKIGMKLMFMKPFPRANCGMSRASAAIPLPTSCVLSLSVVVVVVMVAVVAVAGCSHKKKLPVGFFRNLHWTLCQQH